MTNVYFLHQIKHNKTSGVFEKGIVVKDDQTKNNWDEIRQSYHAYLGAYAYGHDTNTDYVQCEVTNLQGQRLLWETWDFLPKDNVEENTEEEETE